MTQSEFRKLVIFGWQGVQGSLLVLAPGLCSTQSGHDWKESSPSLSVFGVLHNQLRVGLHMEASWLTHHLCGLSIVVHQTLLVLGACDSAIGSYGCSPIAAERFSCFR